jgi:hypothetical protein
VDAIPALGTGKTDLRKVKQMAADITGAGASQSFI